MMCEVEEIDCREAVGVGGFDQGDPKETTPAGNAEQEH